MNLRVSFGTEYCKVFCPLGIWRSSLLLAFLTLKKKSQVNGMPSKTTTF